MSFDRQTMQVYAVIYFGGLMGKFGQAPVAQGQITTTAKDAQLGAETQALTRRVETQQNRGAGGGGRTTRTHRDDDEAACWCCVALAAVCCCFARSSGAQ